MIELKVHCLNLGFDEASGRLRSPRTDYAVDHQFLADLPGVPALVVQHRIDPGNDVVEGAFRELSSNECTRVEVSCRPGGELVGIRLQQIGCRGIDGMVTVSGSNRVICSTRSPKNSMRTASSV